MSFIALANNEPSPLPIYEKTDTVSIISEQPSYKLKNLHAKIPWHQNNPIHNISAIYMLTEELTCGCKSQVRNVLV